MPLSKPRESESGFWQQSWRRNHRPKQLGLALCMLEESQYTRHGIFILLQIRLALVSAPLVESDAWVGSLVQTRNLHQWGGRSAAAAGNSQLSTFHVELRFSDMAFVDGNVFGLRRGELVRYEEKRGNDGTYPNQVFAIWDLARNGELDPVLLPRSPAGVVTDGTRDTALKSLEPVSTAIVGIDSRRSFGHVDKCRTGVFDHFVEGELETNLVASLDIVGLGEGTLRSLVADEVGRANDVGGIGGHVRVGVLADVGVVGSNGGVVHNELREDVVCVGERCCQQSCCGNEGPGGLMHCEKDLNECV